MDEIAEYKSQFNGINKERKVKNRKLKEQHRGKFYYAKDHTFKKQNNTLPVKWLNQIVCADSLKTLQSLPDNCIDLVFTSPPYNFGLDYSEDKNNDSMDWESYFSNLFEILEQCIRVLKYGGRFVINIQPLFSE